MENQTIGNLIAKIRKDKKMTQKDLAEKLNITDRAVSKWERGICCPDISLLKKLSEILDVSISELICGTKENITDEDINNTIAYTKNNIYEKIKRISNTVLVTIVVFLIGFVLFNTIKINLRLHQKYNYTQEFLGIIESLDLNLDRVDNINTNIDLILSQQGKYNDDDYKLISNYVSKLKKTLQNTNYLLKDYYTYNDLINIYNNLNNGLLTETIKESTNIYTKLVKYDSDKLSNLLISYDTFNEHMIFKQSISSLIYNITSYYYEVPKTLANNIYIEINNNYNMYDLLLDDIIEVGGINENI